MQITRCAYNCGRYTQTFSYAMHIAKTDQAARMRSSCCRNSSALSYRGTHIYAPINEYHWAMSAQSECAKAQITRCAYNCGRYTQTFSYAMHIAKTDQAARMRSSCCRNSPALSYRGTHIYAPINEYHWTMSAQSEWAKQSTTCADRLLDNHVVISESRESRLRSLVR